MNTTKKVGLTAAMILLSVLAVSGNGTATANPITYAPPTCTVTAIITGDNHIDVSTWPPDVDYSGSGATAHCDLPLVVKMVA